MTNYAGNLGWQSWIATTNATNVVYPSGVYYQQLPSVIDPAGERDARRLAELTPVEWLRRQIDDVCALAAAS